MKITDLQIHHLELPFRVAFSHASQTRKTTDSVLVSIKSESGNTGYGEGCPRSYVTGESWESAKIFFDTNKDSLKTIQNYNDLLSWTETNESNINQNPAAWCAVELAILDLMGKEKEQTIEEVLGLPQLSGEFQYTAVIGTKSMAVFYIQALLYKLKGFSNFKLKIFGKGKEDKKRIRFLRMINKKGTLRLDANNLWANARQVSDYLKGFNYPFLGIEEPLTANQYQALGEIGQRLNIPLILDESFLRLSQFEEISQYATRWIINIRVSKMGGLVRSIKICEEARKRKIPIIIGAQVGETSVLTRAALSLANAFRDILVGQEGAFGTYLLEKDITKPSIRFGGHGILKASNVSKTEKYGLGLFVELHDIG